MHDALTLTMTSVRLTLQHEFDLMAAQLFLTNYKLGPFATNNHLLIKVKYFYKSP